MDTIITLCALSALSLLVNLAFTPVKKEALKQTKTGKRKPSAPQEKETPKKTGINYREEVRKMFLMDSEGMANTIKGSLENKGR